MNRCLNPDELSQVVRACAVIRIPTRTPDYLQEFIAQCLEDGHPALAAKVRALDADQMHALGEYIRSAQGLLS
jgi:hypothetical protein